MTYEKAKEQYDSFSPAQKAQGVYLRSRGKLFPLEFTIELSDGKIVMVANVPRSKDDDAESAKPAKPVRK